MVSTREALRLLLPSTVRTARRSSRRCPQDILTHDLRAQTRRHDHHDAGTVRRIDGVVEKVSALVCWREVFIILRRGKQCVANIPRILCLGRLSLCVCARFFLPHHSNVLQAAALHHYPFLLLLQGTGHSVSSLAPCWEVRWGGRVGLVSLSLSLSRGRLSEGSLWQPASCDVPTRPRERERERGKEAKGRSASMFFPHSFSGAASAPCSMLRRRGQFD